MDKVKLKSNEYNHSIKTEIIASINVAEGILDYAEDKNIDLIVIGTRGKSGSRRHCLEVLQQML